MKTDPSPPQRSKVITILWSMTLCLVLSAIVCVIVLSGIAKFLAQSHPALALSLWPFDAEASARPGAARVRPRQPGQLPGGGLRPAPAPPVGMAPLDTGGLRVLGLAAARRGDVTGADRYMAASQRRSLRDSVTALWVFDRGMDQKDYVESFRAADTILRRRSDLAADLLYPAMTLAVNTDPAAVRAAVARLALAPGWRTSFIKAVVRDADRTDGPDRLLAALRKTDHPPTDEEAGAYLNRLLMAHLYTAAYASWTEDLPRRRQPGASLLYNGDFQWLPPALPPFDWELYPSGAASAQFATAPGRKGAGLYVRYAGGLISQPVASQLLMLPSGRYRFSGMTLFGETMEPERLHWLVKCENGDMLAELVNTSPSPRWRPFELFFVAPPSDHRSPRASRRSAAYGRQPADERCEAQRLVLEASPGTSLEPFTAWYAGLRIDRLGPVPRGWSEDEPAAGPPRQTPGKATGPRDAPRHF